MTIEKLLNKRNSTCTPFEIDFYEITNSMYTNQDCWSNECECDCVCACDCDSYYKHYI